MFAYCNNGPVLHADTTGTRVTIATSDYLGAQPIYQSDGVNRSDEVMDRFKDELPNPHDYSDFSMIVTSCGNCKKNTDRSLEQAEYLISTYLSFLIPNIGKFLGPINAIYGFMDITSQSAFPDGYYDTYNVDLSWTETYIWDGGQTITYSSYRFVICWDSVSSAEPFWHISEVINNSHSEVLYSG